MDGIARDRKGQRGVPVIALNACDDVDESANDRFDPISWDWAHDRQPWAFRRLNRSVRKAIWGGAIIRPVEEPA
jgi:hypothetical protein